MTNSQVIVDGLVTNYYQAGNGNDCVLFLHGWGDSAQTFNELAKTLDNDRTCIILDLPGFGKTDAPKTAWGINEYAKFVANFLTKTGLEATIIIGHSNGGAIAIRGLANGSLDADKLVLLASAGVRDTYKGRKKILRLTAKTAKVLIKPLPKNVKDKLKKRAYESIGSEIFVAENLQETFKKVVGDDVQSDAKNITIPTLLIYGDEDLATPVIYGEKLHNRIDGSALHVLPKTGHFVHHDSLDKVARYIKEFLK